MEKRPNNYFDDIPIHRSQMVILAILVLAYFFDQTDNMVLGYVAPSVMKTFGITMKEFAPAQSLYFIGMMCGGIVAGLVSDRIGRRRAFLCGCALFTFATLFTGFTNNIYSFTFFRVLTGFGVLGTGSICITYLSEVLSASDRSKWSGICVGLGHVAVPVIGLVGTQVIPMGPEAWRFMFYQGVLGLIPLTLGLLFMKESPRWLIAQGRQDEAEAVVEAYCGEKIDLSAAAEKARAERTGKPGVRQCFSKMFGDPKYRWRTIILFLITAGQNIPSFVFHGWNTTLVQANGVEQAAALTISTLGAVGIPLGIIASGYVGALGGRKISIGVQILLVGALIAAYMTVPYNFYVLAALYFSFQFISMCCAMCLNLYMAESFPTEIRNTGFGVVNASGRCAVAAAQWMVPYLYAAAGSTGVGAFIAGVCLMGGLVTLILGWRTGSAALEEVC